MRRSLPTAIGCFGSFAVICGLLYLGLNWPSNETWRLIGVILGSLTVVGIVILFVSLTRIIKRDPSE